MDDNIATAGNSIQSAVVGNANCIAVVVENDALVSSLFKGFAVAVTVGYYNDSSVYRRTGLQSDTSAAGCAF